MTRTNIQASITVILAAALLAACSEKDDPADADGDAAPDAEIDVEEDLPDVPVDPGEEEATCPPPCPSAPPDHERFGQPCLSEMDCGSGNRCLTETVEVYDGETYVSWLGGTCATWGADEAGCDPEDPTTCPTGTTCVNFGTNAGSTYYGCVDACSFTDASYNPLDWNCGCRQGYECNLNLEACMPGCAHDRECCEVWEDLDDDGVREDGEVHLDEDCTNWCDADDPDEFPADDCMASFACINEGDPSATYHSECLFDSDCPRDSRCLNEVYYYDDETGEPYYPDGLCLKDRCNLFGRDCESGHEGDCVNLGSTADPFYACIAACETGYGPEDDDLNPCRHPSGGHPYTCSPYDTTRWFPGTANDGLCFPAMVPAADPDPLFSPCSVDEDCVSPKGLGACLTLMDKPGFCGALCNQHLAEDVAICGAPDTGGVVAGICALDICVPACDTVRGDVGANGCPTTTGLPAMACYPNDGSYGGTSHVASGGTAPAGFCLPACTSTADCGLLWSGPVTCDTTSGVCG